MSKMSFSANIDDPQTSNIHHFIFQKSKNGSGLAIPPLVIYRFF
jgi:hypothetical protein